MTYSVENTFDLNVHLILLMVYKFLPAVEANSFYMH